MKKTTLMPIPPKKTTSPENTNSIQSPPSLSKKTQKPIPLPCPDVFRPQSPLTEKTSVVLNTSNNKPLTTVAEIRKKFLSEQSILTSEPETPQIAQEDKDFSEISLRTQEVIWLEKKGELQTTLKALKEERAKVQLENHDRKKTIELLKLESEKNLALLEQIKKEREASEKLVAQLKTEWSQKEVELKSLGKRKEELFKQEKGIAEKEKNVKAAEMRIALSTKLVSQLFVIKTQDNAHIIAEFIENAYDPNVVSTEKKSTVLHEAATMGAWNFIDILLQQREKKPNANLLNKQGLTPLEIILSKDLDKIDIAIVKKLLKNPYDDDRWCTNVLPLYDEGKKCWKYPQLQGNLKKNDSDKYKQLIELLDEAKAGILKLYDDTYKDVNRQLESSIGENKRIFIDGILTAEDDPITKQTKKEQLESYLKERIEELIVSVAKTILSQKQKDELSLKATEWLNQALVEIGQIDFNDVASQKRKAIRHGNEPLGVLYQSNSGTASPEISRPQSPSSFFKGVKETLRLRSSTDGKAKKPILIGTPPKLH